MPDEFDEPDEKYVCRLKYRQQCLADWWQAFIKEAFESLFIRSKWKTQQRNVKVGNLVLMRNQGKVVTGEYRRGKVVEVLPSKDGLVRNIIVQRYIHDKRRQVDIYKGKGQSLVKMAVQSLVILLPVEEQVQLREDTGDLSDGQVTREALITWRLTLLMRKITLVLLT